jgi:general secretion pathway protein H
VTGGRHARRRGFSLIEMLVVLALLGVAVTLAVPRFGRSAAAGDLGAVARQVQDALREARSVALAQGRDIAVAIDPGGRSLWIDGQRRALGGRGATAADIRASGGAPILFHAVGGSSGGRILLRAADRRREILVEPVTGRIRDAR